MTKKLTYALSALLLVLALSACSKSPTVEKLLKTVPENTSAVAVFNADQIVDQLDIKVSGDKLTYCPELTEAMGQVDQKDLKTAAELYQAIDHQMVYFLYKEQVIFTGLTKDEKKLIEIIKADAEVEFKEAEGFKMTSNGNFAVRDGQFWFSPQSLDASTLYNLTNLKDKESFAGKYSGLTAELADKNATINVCANFSSILNVLREQGMLQQVAMLQTALTTAYKDAKMVTMRLDMDKNGINAVAKLVNEEGKPAEYLLKSPAINTSVLNNIDNNAFLVAALAVSPDAVKAASAALSAMGGDNPLLASIAKLQGTACVAINQEKFNFAVEFASPEDASQVASMLQNLVGGRVHYRSQGNLLLGGNTPAAGSAPAIFKDAYMGVNINFAGAGAEKVLGMPCADLGSLAITVAPESNSIAMKAVWNHKDPLKTLLKLSAQAKKNIITAPADEPEVVIPEDFIEPEPDETADLNW